MKGLILNLGLFFLYLIHFSQSEEEIYMRLFAISNGEIRSIKIIGKVGLTGLPSVANKMITWQFSGKPNSKLEIKVNTIKPIRLAALLYVGTTLYDTNTLVHWKDTSGNDFEHLASDNNSLSFILDSTPCKYIGQSNTYSNDLTYIFNIPDLHYCSDTNSKGISPINYVRINEVISPPLLNYVYSPSVPITPPTTRVRRATSAPLVTLELRSDTLFGDLKDKDSKKITALTPFLLEDIKYEGTAYGVEIIAYKIETYSEICNFEIRICFKSCDECLGNSSANKKNELCTKCASAYAKVSNTVEGNQFQCFFRTETIDGYFYDKNYYVFYPCEVKCKTCSLKGTDTVSSCDTCNNPDYIEKENTKECYSHEEYKRSYPNFYHDLIDKRYYPCNVACALCTKPSITETTHCDKCSAGYYFYEGIGDSENCIIKKSNNDGFILVPDINTYKKCHPACRVCNVPAKNDCKICTDSTAFISGTTTCVDNSQHQIEVDGAPYYKDTKDDNYYPCNQYCSTCLVGEVPLNHNCEYCKTDYVFKEEEQLNCFDSKTSNFIGYYFEPTDNIYMKCFPICGTCIKRGDEKTNNCDTCVDGYSLVKDQAGRCIMKTGVLDGYYYNEALNLFIKCFVQCSGCTNEGQLTDQKCISCKPGLFHLTLNSNCINPEPISLGKFIEDITVLLPHTDPIKPLEMSSGDYKYILYPYSMQTSIDVNVPYLSFNDCIDIIKDYCSLFDLDDLLIAQNAHNTTKIASTQSNYKFYHKNGNEIDLSKLIQDKISFNATFRLVANATSINYDYAQELSKNNIDYYNPEDPFYNTLCIPYAKGSKDLGLVDRRNTIFPKVTLCQQGCIYQEILFSNYSVKCNCSFDKTVNDTRGFIGQDESSNNFILFKCFSLLNGIKFDNPIILGSFGLIGLKAICAIWIAFSYFTPINAKMNPIIANPPKKNKDSKELNEEEKEKEKEEKEAEGKEEKLTYSNDLNKNATQIKVSSTISKANTQNNENIENNFIQNEEKEEEDRVNSLIPEESNLNAQGDILKLKPITMQSTIKTKEEIFVREIKEKEMKENVELFDKNFMRKNIYKKNEEIRLTNEEIKLTNEENNKECKEEENNIIELNSKDQNDYTKDQPDLVEKEEGTKKRSSMKKGINNFIEKDSNLNNEINDKPKGKRMKPIAEKNGESILSSSIDLGFESAAVKLGSDEANIASFTVIEFECDPRRFWSYFFDLYLEKQMVFTLFKTDNIFYPLSFRMLMFFFNLSSILFFNALLYSPSYLTKRLEATEEIGFGYMIVEEYDKAMFASILAFAIGKVYYIIYYSNAAFLRLCKEGKKNSHRILYLISMHRIKLIALVSSLFAVMPLYYSFTFLFCILYPNNVSGIFYGVLMSLVFNFVIVAVICTVVSFARFIGIDNHLK